MGYAITDEESQRFSAAAHAGALLLRPDGSTADLSEPALPVGFQPDTRYVRAAIETGAGLPLREALQETVRQARNRQQRDRFTDDAALVGLEMGP